MSEFKIDQIGWYESTKKEKYECVRIIKNTAYFLVDNYLISEIQLIPFTTKGDFINNSGEIVIKLARFIGPKILKDQRKLILLREYK